MKCVLKFGSLSMLGFVMICCVRVGVTDGARILLAVYQFSSHVMEVQHIGEALVAKGHDVHILMSPTYPGIDKMRDSKLKVIEHHTPEKDMYSGYSKTDWDNFVQELIRITLIECFRTIIDIDQNMCSNALSDEALVGKLKGMEFDLAIVDVLTRSSCYLILMYRLQLPFVAIATQYNPWQLRNPALPSFVPFNMGAGYSDKMSFMERLDNIWTLLDWVVDPQVPYISDEAVQKYAPDMPPVSMNYLLSRALLWLIDTDVAIDYPRPLMQNEVLIGGLTTKPAQTLPPDLLEFMDHAEDGVILVSFGSVPTLPPVFLDRLMSALKKVKERVIWRYQHDPPSDVPGHIRLMSWIPQNDLLGHPNTKLFITHCGANSQFEALYHQVPMISFPMFAEQHYNAKRAESKGFAITMKSQSFTPDELVTNIQQILTNNSFAENIQHASEIYHDRLQTPTERTVYWIEHVLKHGGAYLHSHALDMPWYAYIMLDVLALVLAILCIAITLVVLIVRSMIKMLGFGKQRKIKVN